MNTGAFIVVAASLVLAKFLASAHGIKTVTVDFTNAPEAKVEDLGITAVGRTGGLGLMAPAPDGTGTNVYFCYYDHAYVRDAWEVVEVNLETGKISHYNSGRKEGLWGWMLGKDGRFYTNANNTVCRFDPKTKQFGFYGPTSPDGSNYSTFWGTDKKLYIGTYPNARVIQFDPETAKFHDYGPQGPERKYPSYAYSITGNDQYIYTARGKQPWYLIALNIQTGEQTQLAEVSQEGTIGVDEVDDVCYATLKREAYKQGEQKQEFFRLDSAKLVAVDKIPAPTKPDAFPRGHAGLNGWEICRWSGYGKADGSVEFWYRKGQGEWQSLTWRDGDTPARINALASLSDGRIAGATDDPYSVFVFDPKENKTTVLGQAPCHVYDILWLDGKLYMSGYANAPLDMYDPAKAWTARPQTPQGFAPEPSDPAANPHIVADFNRAPFLQKRSAAMAVGADGRIYVGCTAEREMTGGTLGWYDPKAGKSDGLQKPFRTQAVQQVLAVNEGRTILCSTFFDANPNDPKEGDHQSHVTAYDIAKGEIVGDVIPVRDVPQWSSCRLVEWKRGKVIGLIGDPVTKGTMFFLLDTPTMTIESRTVLMGEGVKAPVLLADGNLYGVQGKNVYRVNPETWEFAAVAKLPASPRRIVGAGQNLYLAMEYHLMRVSLAAAPAQ